MLSGLVDFDSAPCNVSLRIPGLVYQLECKSGHNHHLEGVGVIGSVCATTASTLLQIFPVYLLCFAIPLGELDLGRNYDKSSEFQLSLAAWTRQYQELGISKERVNSLPPPSHNSCTMGSPLFFAALIPVWMGEIRGVLSKERI